MGVSPEALYLAPLLVLLVGAWFCHEAKAWTPRITEGLVRRAVKRAPVHLRDRLEHEWLSHLYDLPGTTAKVLHSVTIQFAAESLRGPPVWLLLWRRSLRLRVMGAAATASIWITERVFIPLQGRASKTAMLVLRPWTLFIFHQCARTVTDHAAIGNAYALRGDEEKAREATQLADDALKRLVETCDKIRKRQRNQ